MREVMVLVFDGVQLLDVAGPLDVFDAANRITGDEAYRVRVVARDGAAVRAGNGLRIGVDGDLDPPREGPDTLLVPGGWGTEAAMAEPEVIDFVRTVAPRTRRIASACTGAFVLAEAGLMGGHRATTHWAFADGLRAYEGVEVEPDRIFVHDGQVSTAAGVTAGIDLALSLVEQDLGPEVVRTICRWLVVFLHRPGGQSQFSEWLRRPAATSSPIRAVLDLVAANPAADLRVEVLAGVAGMSRRHFAREFRRQTGTTPGGYVERLRIESAQNLLATTADTQSKVARAVGFGSDEAMRQAFQRRLGIAPGAYRERFRDPGLTLFGDAT